MIVNITDPDQLSYTINDLLINTNYIVELRGRTGAGLGEPATATGTTDEDGELQLLSIVVYNYTVCIRLIANYYLMQHLILLWTSVLSF